MRNGGEFGGDPGQEVVLLIRYPQLNSFARARSIDTLHQATHNLSLPLDYLDPRPPLIAEMHLGTAVPTRTIFHIQKYTNKLRVVQPPMSHRFAVSTNGFRKFNALSANLPG